jgi:hypothetical protein
VVRHGTGDDGADIYVASWLFTQPAASTTVIPMQIGIHASFRERSVKIPR